MTLCNTIVLTPAGYEATIYKGNIIDLSPDEADRLIDNGLALLMKEYSDGKSETKNATDRRSGNGNGSKRVSKGRRKRRG